MAKTPLSLTGNPAIKGAPTGFDLKINDASLSAGAKFVVILAGEVILLLNSFIYKKIRSIIYIHLGI